LTAAGIPWEKAENHMNLQNQNKSKKNLAKLFQLKKIQTDFPNVKITSSGDAYEFVKQFYLDDMEVFESFFLLTLNRAGNTTGFAKISQGGIAGTYVDVKLIAKYSIDALASAVIICHNHPSGNLTPSDADRKITKTIKDGLNILDIKLFDHLILSANGFYSFADNGDM